MARFVLVLFFVASALVCHILAQPQPPQQGGQQGSQQQGGQQGGQQQPPQQGGQQGGQQQGGQQQPPQQGEVIACFMNMQKLGFSVGRFLELEKLQK
uniref:Uncharacterized protein n=1 Tax=Panagrolaimus sp. ES5 TaxID=591445 RepID=A0AC34GF58_9BILA